MKSSAKSNGTWPDTTLKACHLYREAISNLGGQEKNIYRNRSIEAVEALHIKFNINVKLVRAYNKSIQYLMITIVSLKNRCILQTIFIGQLLNMDLNMTAIEKVSAKTKVF